MLGAARTDPEILPALRHPQGVTALIKPAFSAALLGIALLLLATSVTAQAQTPTFNTTVANVTIQISGTSSGGSCGTPVDNGGFSTLGSCQVSYQSPTTITFTISAPAMPNTPGTVSLLVVEVDGLTSSGGLHTISRQSENAAGGVLSVSNSTVLDSSYSGGQIIIDYNDQCSADLGSCVQTASDASHIDIGLTAGGTGGGSQGTGGGITIPSLPSLNLPSDPVSVGVATALFSSIGVLGILGMGPLGGGGGLEGSSGGEDGPPDDGGTLVTLDGGAPFGQAYSWLSSQGFTPDIVDIGGRLYIRPIGYNDPGGQRTGYAFETAQIYDPVSGTTVEVIDTSYPIQAIFPPGQGPPPPRPAPVQVDTNPPPVPVQPAPPDDAGTTQGPSTTDVPQPDPPVMKPPPAAPPTPPPSRPDQQPPAQPQPWHGPDGPGPYRLTVYVDDSDIVGHTYVSLTDTGGRRVTKGVFDSAVGGDESSVDSAVDDTDSILGLHHSKVRDDSAHGWNVRRTYVIDEDGYQNALDYMKMHEQLCAEGRVYYGALGHRMGAGNAENCNIFARNTMKEAGLQMPESWGLERPHNVASALRDLPGSEQNATEGGYGTDASHHGALRKAGVS